MFETGPMEPKLPGFRKIISLFRTLSLLDAGPTPSALLLSAVPGDSQGFYFTGSVSTNARACSTHSASCLSESRPSGSTMIQPFMGRPVTSNSRT